MKKNYFTRLENKFYFKLSRTVWHIIVGLAVLTLLSGIFLALWSFVPVFKDTVTKAIYPVKQAYPKEVTITPRELDALVNPLKKETVGEKKTPKVTYTKTKDTLGLALYEKYLDSLQKVSVPSLTYRLGLVYDKSNLNNYLDKTKLLKAYLIATGGFEGQIQRSLLRTLLEYPKNSLYDNITLSELLTTSCNEVRGKDLAKTLSVLGAFSRHNPAEGFSFIRFINRNIVKFEPDNNLSAVKHFVNLHNRRYNNNLDKMIGVSNAFFPMLEPYKKKKQLIALVEYFNLYNKKDNDRNNHISGIESSYRNSIQAIDNQYDADIGRAESEYQRKRADKISKRMKALYGIGSGIATIAIFSIILVLFSLQRLIKRMGEQLDRLTPVVRSVDVETTSQETAVNQNSDETLFE